MPVKLDQTEKKLLYFFYTYGKAVSRRRIHELIYKLQNEYGVKLGFTFVGQVPYSKNLDEKLEHLVQKGFLKIIYSTGGNYLNLYKPYYKLTERGARIASKSDFSQTDKEAIDKMVSSLQVQKQQGAKRGHSNNSDLS
ncbi:MAG: hypothetical protein ABWK01_05545 [Infirmifilum sp.]